MIGAGVAGATDNWDSFAGGFTGGLAGAAVGNAVVNTEQFKNWRAGEGFKANRDVKAAKWEQYAKQQRAFRGEFRGHIT